MLAATGGGLIVAGWLSGTQHGTATWPGKYALIAIVVVSAAVLWSRALSRLLRRGEDYYDAD